MGVPQKLQRKIPFDPAISIQGTLLKELKDTTHHSQMLVLGCFETYQIWYSRVLVQIPLAPHPSVFICLVLGTQTRTSRGPWPHNLLPSPAKAICLVLTFWY